MTTITEMPAASKSPAPQRRISIEDVYGDVQRATVLLAALDYFICEVQALNPEKDTAQSYARATLNVDLMTIEVRTVVNDVFRNLGDFISAAPAAHLQVGGTGMSAPAPAPSAFILCDDASCAFERQTILTDAIIEALRAANDDMPVGEGKDRALYEVWCLLILLRENMSAHDKMLEQIQASIGAERKAA